MSTIPLSTRRLLGTADLHVHTQASDGEVDARQLFEFVEEQRQIDVIGITDHDDITGALKAREIHARGNYHFDMVVGTEVWTRGGHLLALWVDRPIPTFRTLEWTIAEIHRAGGIAIVPHPASLITPSVSREALERILKGDPISIPDGVELANGSPAWRPSVALRSVTERGVAKIGSSDAHFPECVGHAVTRFPGNTADELRTAILRRETTAHTIAQFSLKSLGVGRVLRQQIRANLIGSPIAPGRLIASALGRLSRCAKLVATGRTHLAATVRSQPS